MVGSQFRLHDLKASEKLRPTWQPTGLAQAYWGLWTASCMIRIEIPILTLRRESGDSIFAGQSTNQSGQIGNIDARRTYGR
jgi:hypothetical protein